MEQLQNRDFTLIVDKSGSMGTNDVKGRTRWSAAQEATLGLTNKICELDKDGITFYAFSSKFKRHDNVTPETVANLWKEHEPNGSTDLAAVLQDAFNSYFQRKKAGLTKANGETILVVTDGVPDDQKAVVDQIISTTKKMDKDEELSVSFIQVGADTNATTYLKKLDDELTKFGAKYDIVDSLTIEEMGERSLSDVLLSSITD